MNDAAPNDLNAHIDAISERIDRLALRHAELQRTNALLELRVRQLETERDGLRARLAEARARVDTLLARLDPPASEPSA